MLIERESIAVVTEGMAVGRDPQSVIAIEPFLQVQATQLSNGTYRCVLPALQSHQMERAQRLGRDFDLYTRSRQLA